MISQLILTCKHMDRNIQYINGHENYHLSRYFDLGYMIMRGVISDFSKQTTNWFRHTGKCF